MQRLMKLCMASAAMLAVAGQADADQGTVLKWLQAPENQTGENVPSDVDWRRLEQNPTVPTEPNWVVADDFRSDGRPILTVRWWGSYFPVTATGPNPNEPDFDPGSNQWKASFEEGYILSFFSDKPADPSNNLPSRPDDLLGTYVAPIDKVRIQPALEPSGNQMIGWDGHPIWRYEANLQDTHLDHAVPGLSEPISFNEREGVVYWLSVQAENGAVINPDWTITHLDPSVDPFPDTLVADDHFWGWHTSPSTFNDEPSMNHLLMGGAGATGDWVYLRDQWRVVDRVHGDYDMAFGLLTIPEPASLALLAIGALLVATRRRT